MSIIDKLMKNELNCNIFSVYDYDGLTIQELLCQFYTKINDCIDKCNELSTLKEWLVSEGIRSEVAEMLEKWLNDGTLENIISESLLKSLTEKINKIETLKNEYLISHTQQKAVNEKFKNGDKIYSDDRILSYNSLMKYFNDLQAINTNYITSEILGTSQGGQYNIYKYKLTPKSPRLKVLLVSGLHGSEYVYPFTLYSFMEDLARKDIHKYPYLQELRENVEFTILPLMNPHGWEHNNRTNKNDVDLNRNFDYKWSESTATDKGTAPFSEAETKLIKQVLESEGFHLVLDLHNTHDLTQDFYSTYDSTKANNFIVKQVLDMFNQKKIYEKGSSNGILLDGTASKPTLQAYSNKVIQTPSYTMEWVNSSYSDDKTTWYNSTHMTKAYELLLNMVYKNYKYMVESTEKGETQVYQFNMVGGTSVYVENSDYSKINKFTHSIKAPFDCVVTFSGGVTILNSANQNVNACISLNKVGQLTNNEQFTNEHYSDYNGRFVLPLNASYTFSKGDNIYTNLYIKASNSKATIYRYRGILEIKPNSKRTMVTKQ